MSQFPQSLGLQSQFAIGPGSAGAVLLGHRALHNAAHRSSSSSSSQGKPGTGGHTHPRHTHPRRRRQSSVESSVIGSTDSPSDDDGDYGASASASSSGTASDEDVLLGSTRRTLFRAQSFVATPHAGLHQSRRRANEPLWLHMQRREGTLPVRFCFRCCLLLFRVLMLCAWMPQQSTLSHLGAVNRYRCH